MNKLTSLIPFAFVLLWSTGFVGAKYAMPYADPFYFLLIRVLLTIAVLALLALLLQKTVNFTRIKQPMIVGALIHGGYLGGVFVAISHHMSAGVTAIIVGLQPILTASLIALTGKEELSKRLWFGLVMGFLGVVIVILDSKGVSSDGLSTIGVLAALTALVSISLGTVLQKQWGASERLFHGTIWQYIGAAMVFAAMSFAFEDQNIEWAPSLIYALIWLVFGLSIGAIFLLMLMIKEGAATKVASYFYLVPPLVMIEGYVLFGEEIGALGVIGTLLVVIAIWIVMRSQPRVNAAPK